MIGRYRVVSVCPAGRRRYLELLVPYLLEARGLIDEHEWWVNTRVPEDLDYLLALSGQHPEFFRFVELHDQPFPAQSTQKRADEKARQQGNLRIGKFFPRCVDPATIYLRVDDDIVYVAPGAFRELLEFRVNNPEPFLVYPSIVNNAWMSHLHQRQGAFGRNLGVCEPEPFGPAWSSGELGAHVHRSFLDAVRRGREDSWKLADVKLTQYERVSINCIAWFGRDIQKFRGLVRGDEEHFLSTLEPQILRQPNVIHGQAIVAHFSYFKQRPHLDASDLLLAYRSLLGATGRNLRSASSVEWDVV